MPKLLSERIKKVDSINGFLTAARMRFDEGRELAQAGHRTAAIYLWGYVAEAVLKAGWFRLKGFAPAQAIKLDHLRDARKEAIAVLGVSWPNPSLHDIENWSRAVVLRRAIFGPAYPSPLIAAEIVSHATRIYLRWSESVRYKPNRAFVHEMTTVSDSAFWFLQNAAMI